MNILHDKDSGDGDKMRLGPYEIESLVSRDEEGAFTAYRVRIEANEETSESYHKRAEEIYFVVEGCGEAILDGVTYPLEKGDFLRLPPRVKHRFVTGDEALVMLDIHTPGSRPDRDVYFTGKTPDGFTAM